MDTGEDDSEGWDAVEKASTSQDPQQHLFNRSDDADVDLQTGWEEVAASDSGFNLSPKAVSLPSVNSVSSKRPRGRPTGTRGSHAFRESLRKAIAEQEAESANKPKPKARSAEQLKQARDARFQKSRSQGELSTISVISDSSPEVGSALELQVFASGLKVIAQAGCSFDRHSSLDDSRSHSSSHHLSLSLSRSQSQSSILGVGSARARDKTVASHIARARASDVENRPDEDQTSKGFQLAKFMHQLRNPHLSPWAFGSEFGSELESLEKHKPSVTEEELTPSQKLLDHLFKPYRGYASMSRDAEAFNATKQSFSRNMIRSACALKLAYTKLWGNMLSHVKSMIDPGSSHDPVIFIARFRFDETPSKIRVHDLESKTLPETSNPANAKPTLAKILQTEFSISVLLKTRSCSPNAGDAVTGTHVMLSGVFPTPLQVLDRQTSRNLKMALEDSMKVAGLEDVANKFPQKLFLFCTDEFSSNDLAQFSMQAARKDWLRVSTLCDIHKMSTCQGKVFELTGSAISAVINFALSMVQAGSTAKLQNILSDVISSRFQLCIGKPNLSEDAQEYTKSILDLYLSIPDDLAFALKVENATSSRQRQRYTFRKKQRSVIQLLCNGDLRNHNVIQHFALPGQYVDSDHALQVFLRYVVPVLVPSACPVFPRSRWFGADGALNFVGLLFSIHGLFPAIVAQWCGKSIPRQLHALSMDELDAIDDEGWDFNMDQDNKRGQEIVKVVGKAPLEDADDHSKQKPQESQEPLHPEVASGGNGNDSGEAAEGQGQGGGEEGSHPKDSNPNQQSGFDFYEYHQRLKTSVFDWLFGDARLAGTFPSPETEIALARQYMPLKSLAHFLFVSSKGWERDQLQKSAKGEARQYRMLLSYMCEEPSKLLESVVQQLFDPPIAIPEKDWRKDISLLRFTILSRLGCSVHQLMCWRCRKYPYKLFSALLGNEHAQKIFEDKRCVQDELSQSLCSLFPSVEAFASNDCLKIIEAIALQGETDIGPIERQHAISRRVIQTRSLTHGVALRSLSADWLLRQSIQKKTDSFTFLHFDSNHAIEKLKRQQKKHYKQHMNMNLKKKRRGGGGAFRAYVSSQTKGQTGKPDAAALKEIARKYKLLDQEQKEFYAEAGILGTKSHRMGLHSFGPQPPRKKHRTKRERTRLALADAAPEALHIVDESTSNPFAIVPSSDFVALIGSSFSHEESLNERLAIISEEGRNAHKQSEASRNDAHETFNAFLQGRCTSQPQSAAPFVDGHPKVDYPGSEDLQHGLVPKPSRLPWLEWVPPADLFAKARHFTLKVMGPFSF